MTIRLSSSSQTRRRVALLLLATSLLLLLSRLPPYPAWIRMVISYFRHVPRHLTTESYDQKMYDRLGPTYFISQQLRDEFLRPGDVLLLPPIGYVRNTFSETHWAWTEPKFFYYMVGPQKTVTVGSPEVHVATCTVFIDANGQPQFTRFSTPDDRERTIRFFSAWSK